MCQYFALKLQPLVLASETIEFLAFRTRQPVLPAPFVQVSLVDPAPDRHRRRLNLLPQLIWAAASSNELDHFPTVFFWIRWACSRHARRVPSAS